MKLRPILICILAAVFHGEVVCADTSVHRDADIMAQVSFNPVPGTPVPSDLKFSSTRGPVTTGAILQNHISLLTFAWFDCPNLCGLILNGLADSSSRLPDSGKQDFQIVVVSMDPGATRDDAIHQQQNLTRRYPEAGVMSQWSFLRGSADSIEALANATGFQFVYDPRKAQFAHPSGVVILDTQGRVRDFMAGINYRTADIERLIASARSPGSRPAPANPILLLCYDYDPSSGRYSLAIMKLLRLVSLLCLFVFAVVFWRWRKREAGKTP